jgi:hypothetical protein
MQATLKQIHTGADVLARLKNAPLPGAHIKLAYKIKRLIDAIGPEHERIRVHLNQLIKEHGEQTGPDAWQVKADQLPTFNLITEDFLSPTIELNAHKITIEEIERAGNFFMLSSNDLALIEWVIDFGAMENGNGAGHE